MEKSVYVNLKKPIETGGVILNTLSIDIEYQKGGANYYNGSIDERGVYAIIKPCRRENGSIRMVFTGKRQTDGYKILLLKLSRNCKIKTDLMAAKVLPYAQKIADLYSDGQHNGVYQLIKSVV